MRFSLTHSDDEFIEFEGKRFKLTLYFDRVIAMQSVLNDESTEPADAEKLALFLLCEGAERLKDEQYGRLLALICREHLKSEENKGKGKRLFDFEQDAEHIYSSFMMDYGIDLKEQRGKLLWKNFLALFKGLSEKTKMREIMSIRSRDIPAPTKYNQEEIKALTELKRFYALKGDEEIKGESFAEGLAGLAEILKRNAVVKGVKSLKNR